MNIHEHASRRAKECNKKNKKKKNRGKRDRSQECDWYLNKQGIRRKNDRSRPRVLKSVFHLKTYKLTILSSTKHNWFCFIKLNMKFIVFHSLQRQQKTKELTPEGKKIFPLPPLPPAINDLRFKKS